jgi:hypothetical protein
MKQRQSVTNIAGSICRYVQISEANGNRAKLFPWDSLPEAYPFSCNRDVDVITVNFVVEMAFNKDNSKIQIVNQKSAFRKNPILESARDLGAYTVRFLFVTCGFSIPETEGFGSRFLLGRAPDTDRLIPF